MKLIDKDAILKEIDSLLDKGKYHDEYDCAYRDGNNGVLYALKDRISKLEVKEIELDKPFKGISVNTSFDGDDNLDTITITTKYYKKKGG